MDKRIAYKIVFDCETCPIDRTIEEVTPSNMLCYDYGWQVVDKRGNVYRRRSFINRDIFIKERERMQSAYYANKIPQYWRDVWDGKRKMASYYEIVKAFREDVAEFNVKQVYAHNMRFDYGATNNTARYLTNSKYKYFFPYGMEICDTLKMARDVFGKMKTYLEFCETNHYTTKNGKPRFTAEILYRYISGNNEFIEQHTGLEDVEIETEILVRCYRSHKKMRRALYS